MPIEIDEYRLLHLPTGKYMHIGSHNDCKRVYAHIKKLIKEAKKVGRFTAVVTDSKNKTNYIMTLGNSDDTHSVNLERGFLGEKVRLYVLTDLDKLSNDISYFMIVKEKKVAYD